MREYLRIPLTCIGTAAVIRVVQSGHGVVCTCLRRPLSDALLDNFTPLIFRCEGQVVLAVLRSMEDSW